MMVRYRMALGAVIVGGLMALGVCMALGRVEEKTSYGLTAVVAIVAKVALDFSSWAYGSSKKTEYEISRNDPPAKGPPPEEPPKDG